MRRRRLSSAAAILVLLVTAGCGGEPPERSARPSPQRSPSAEETESPTPVTEPPVACSDQTLGGAVVRLRQVDDAFRPRCLIVLGGQFLRITNDGTKTHNFSVEGTDLDLDIDASSHLTTESVGTIVPPGEVTFFCKYHRAQGMEGQLTVTAAG